MLCLLTSASLFPYTTLFRSDRVAIAVERCLGLMVCVLGVMKAGAAYVPLDASYPADRLKFMLEDSAAKVLVTQEHLVRDLVRSEEHTSELQSHSDLVCRLLL